MENYPDTDGSPDIGSQEARSKGRPQAISDEDLLSSRNNLVVLLENTWGEVGWNLRHCVRTQSDVRAAFEVWQKEPIRPYPADALLRPSDQSSDEKHLSALVDQKNEILRLISEAEKHRQRCIDSLAKANRALITVTNDQHDLVAEHVSERKANLEQAETTFLSLQSRLKNVEEQIKDSHAYLAQAEVLQFCTKGRYAFNPLNVANAIAGLPSIGYRRSIDRCRQWKREDGLPYRVFLILERICESWPREITFAQHAEDWLRSQHPSPVKSSRKSSKQRIQMFQNVPDAATLVASGGYYYDEDGAIAQIKSHQFESFAIGQLQQKWYYLRRSIAAVLTVKNLLPEELPYRIVTEYLRRTAQPTPVDLLFEEDERIVPH